MEFNVVTFFEKKGCSTNAKQKKILSELGLSLNIVDLLSYPFTKQELKELFNHLPVAQWFNKNAPKIKSGDINPHDMDELTALNLILKEPILIHRPLIMMRGKRMVGFDLETICSELDIDYEESDEDFESCSHS